VGQATRTHIGLSDRTLGNRIPDRRWKAGDVLRSRLTALGILRGSGHEAFRGCVVVPVTDADGTVTALYGRRTDRSGAEQWAGGLPGGIFGRSQSGETTLVVASIPAALHVIGAGHDAVVAPGRPKGLSKADLAALASERADLVVMGQGTVPLADELARRGAAVSLAAQDIDLAAMLGTAPDAGAALGALLADAVPVVTAVAESGDASPVPTPVLATLVPAGGDVDEVYVHTGSHSWRVRGAAARANSEGELLRVALSVTDSASGRFHLDTLDLYSARQRRGFLAAATTELRVERDVLAAELAEVIGAAERRRDDSANHKPVPVPVMSDAERAEAMDLLTDPDLLGRLCSDLAALGVVGEQTNLVVCYLGTISRLCERPFGVLVQSSSAAGKSTLSDAVCSLLPSEDLVALSAITTQALYYLGGADLSRKVLAVAEEQGAARASYALKLLVSEGRLSIASTGKDKSSGKLSTANYEIAGPIALVMTTTATDVDPELENRLVVLGIDEDAAQTQAIVEAQRRSATLDGLKARATRERLRTLHANAQRLLAPYPVVISDLDTEFPTTATRHRRDHAKLLSIVSALTVLHQHQREHKTLVVGDTTVEYLEASADDVANGIALARQVLVRGTDNLSPQAARLRAVFEEVAREKAAESECDLSEVGVTRRELRERLGWSDKQVRSGTDRLVALEYLVVSGSGRGRCRTYSYVFDIGQVGPSSGPVGPGAGRTSDATSPGKTERLAQLAQLDEARITSPFDVVASEKTQGGESRP
jgi:Fe2+ transport system protein FeoA